ncbi:MAG: DUF1259 domain-containing protein [Mesobacillus sp.]|uniref:DUF1259 domain-containing protein n=1 Tax=Mesobacillus sp. TaxID=2675271 RepID=UPI003C6083B7
MPIWERNKENDAQLVLKLIQLVLNFAQLVLVIGEFALPQEEVNPVIDELRKGNIDISAFHNHMLFEEPRTCTCTFKGKSI